MESREMNTLVFNNISYEVVDKTARNNIQTIQENVTIDKTLTKANQSAEAKATGDAINGLSESTNTSINSLRRDTNAAIESLQGTVSELNTIASNLRTLVGNTSVHDQIANQIDSVNEQIAEIINTISSTIEPGLMSASDKEFLSLLRATFTITDDAIDIGGKYIDNASFR